MIPINKDSHNPWALETIKDLAGYLDFLFIDGDHSYEGVKKDWEMYSPLVRKGGLIAFHDIAPNYDSGSRKFYNEIKDGFEHVEFVEDAEQDIMGIGVLRK
jgi:predicted O-methyltransferase YrrM